MNTIAILVAALVPILIGFLWYSDKGFGNVWMREGKLNKTDLAKGNFPIIIVLCLILSLFISVMVHFIVVHQSGAVAMVGGDPALGSKTFSAFMEQYGLAYRTFKHGALHGALAGLLFAFPIIAINSLFERKSWKYIFIHSAYWTLTLTIMGSIICGWV